jgi:lipoprotein-anchoring transpeptidase ErfK/SrfK
MLARNRWRVALRTGILACMRLAALASMLLVAVLALPSAAAAKPRLPHGTVIAGVVVGDLGPRGAQAKLEQELEPVYGRRISVRAGGSRTSVSPTEAGQFIRYKAMIARAYELMGQGEVVIEVPLMRQIRSGVLSRAVNRVAGKWYRAPRNASYRYGITHVSIRGARYGRGVNKRRLRKALVAEIRRPHEQRIVKARFVRVRPAVTVKVLKRRAGTFVSVDRRSKIVRLFKHLRVVRSYRVAVGAAGYDTPRGMHRVLSKERHPTWHVPNRPWAGNLAGQTIPPGDPRNPLKAAFIAIGNGVGFHGTADLNSIGQAASHGCIRMRVGDVLSLYRNVPVGTPVLVR